MQKQLCGKISEAHAAYAERLKTMLGGANNAEVLAYIFNRVTDTENKFGKPYLAAEAALWELMQEKEFITLHLLKKRASCQYHGVQAVFADFEKGINLFNTNLKKELRNE
jgi:hypothetical protein